MIAEYERAQILERSRRGKRHRAREGQVNVLSGAPYGYRYVRKNDDAAARHEIIATEADIVRAVHDHYVVAGMSIGAITRLLNERGVPTRKQVSRWERSTVWAMLRNPAYKGTACFGKTETAPRQRITRPLRLRGGISSRASAHHERPRAAWIEIAVPALVDDNTFAQAQELLVQNKKLAPRRTIAPSIVQGFHATNAAMCCGVRRRARVPAPSTTTDASAPMLCAASVVRYAITVQSARISSTTSCGPRWSACWRIPA
jgi:site-specific DNA recombinase